MAFEFLVLALFGEYWDPDKAQGFFHEFQGWLIFVVTLILLFAFHRLINLIWKPIPDSKGEPARRPTRRADLANGVAKRSPVQAPLSMRSPRFLVPALLMFATAAGLQAHSQDEIFPPRQPLSALPAQVDGWTGTDETLDQPTLDILGPGEFLVRDYENASQPQPWIGLFIAYFPSQKMGDTIHSPNHCLPGAGWVPTVKQIDPA